MARSGLHITRLIARTLVAPRSFSGTRTATLRMVAQNTHTSAICTSSVSRHISHSSLTSQPPREPGSIHTVNKEEIAKFAAMSDEWWAPQGPFKMLHLMNAPRIRYISDRLKDSGALLEGAEGTRFPLKGLCILDVGCGGGLLSEALARLGATVTGLDAAFENIEMAKIHAKRDPLFFGSGPGSLEYHHQTAESLLEQGRQFDVVCSMEVIEHVDNPAGFLEVLGKLVKPNGNLMLSTISRTRLAYFLTIFSAEHLMRMVPVGTHEWSKYITPSELSTGVKTLAGCTVLDIQGIGFNPVAGQWHLLSKNMGLGEKVNYMLTAKKISS